MCDYYLQNQARFPGRVKDGKLVLRYIFASKEDEKMYEAKLRATVAHHFKATD
jgi:hypothetical protein